MHTWLLWSVPAQREAMRAIVITYDCAVDVLAGIKEPFTKTFPSLMFLCIFYSGHQLKGRNEEKMVKDGLAKKERGSLCIVIGLKSAGKHSEQTFLRRSMQQCRAALL
jgi:hypothetical protein